ncbi:MULTISPECIES: helix-turn-helix domain-containing protein [Cyanophyceae]|uniref:winged helix-turn-helix transcriptional regulator n=1 Tax=Cyanophyceae TaxID=3028117 RepID=UPI0016861447|nr:MULTISPECIES: helix-turn-helix domain-containing protein [Cyanophyceae]MBD1918333.1 helix-turn-helix transcriptional regulator [Phormidium sp. FACHB-77]MBD2028798.1 helix-turn-helix transcriptional regulator [Phormidium sp. FACHB-322]MBD2051219.1 helix-turn-helix transcriptional regulator [Leptolyngbya sp. FACHB-60]
MVLNPKIPEPELSYLPQPALDRIANMGIFDTQCEGHQLLEKIANKWTILLIYALIQGKKRYSDIKQQVVGISPKMLVQNLRSLERLGLIRREVYPTVPPRVDYSLTQLGESLSEPLAVLGEWAYQHISDIDAATKKYDSKPDAEDFWQPK